MSAVGGGVSERFPICAWKNGSGLLHGLCIWRSDPEVHLFARMVQRKTLTEIIAFRCDVCDTSRLEDCFHAINELVNRVLRINSLCRENNVVARGPNHVRERAPVPGKETGLRGGVSAVYKGIW
jgi:hypothetical protein